MSPATGPRPGRVEAFDDARGIGTVVDESGRSYPFHCTALTDGTRSIAVGTRVVFEVAAAHLGSYEARSITAAEGPGP
jgi:cold shock CspA family protein